MYFHVLQQSSRPELSLGLGERAPEFRRAAGKLTWRTLTHKRGAIFLSMEEQRRICLALSDHCVRIERSHCGSVKPVHSLVMWRYQPCHWPEMVAMANWLWPMAGLISSHDQWVDWLYWITMTFFNSYTVVWQCQTDSALFFHGGENSPSFMC